MILGRRPQRGPDDGPHEEAAIGIDPAQLSGVFAAPGWLRDLGLLAWFVVGIGVVVVGVVLVLGITATIVEPVVAGAIVAVVASPVVRWLKAHGVPRAAGAALVLLGFVAVGLVVLGLVLGGIVGHSDDIKHSANAALDHIESWFKDAGASGTSGAKQSTAAAVPNIGQTLLQGVAKGIQGLTSLAFFLSFAALSTFFLLKDGPAVRRWMDRHSGLPLPVATMVSSKVIYALQRYFLGVTIVAAFNGVVVGVAALLLGVPLAGSIAVVTFVTAYVPFVGAFVAGAFAVIITLGSEGTSKALIMLLVVILANGLLQNVFQPFAFGAALSLNPLVVLIVTISAGCLFGMVGLILAAPLVSAAVQISRELGRARGAAALAPEQPPPAAAPV